MSDADICSNDEKYGGFGAAMANSVAADSAAPARAMAALLVHPGSFLALVKVGLGVCREFLLCNAAIWLPLEDKGRRE